MSKFYPWVGRSLASWKRVTKGMAWGFTFNCIISTKRFVSIKDSFPTWNPNDPLLLLEKALFFGGLTFKNRGHLGFQVYKRFISIQEISPKVPLFGYLLPFTCQNRILEPPGRLRSRPNSSACIPGREISSMCVSRWIPTIPKHLRYLK